AGEDALELQHAAFIKDDGVEIRGIDAAALETPVDRARREARVIFPPRQPFLLNGGHGHAVDQERRRRIVVVPRDAENSHLSTGSSTGLRGPARLAPSRPLRAAPRLWRATRTAARRRRTSR